MKKSLSPKLLPLLVLPAGVVGALVRLWLLSTGIDEKGLILPEHPANAVGYILTALALAAIFLCVRSASGEVPYRGLFPPSKVSAAGCWIAAVGIAITLFTEPAQAGDTVARICSAFGAAAVVSLVLTGVRRMQGIRPNPLYHTLVTVYLVLHLVCQYRLWNSETQLTVHFFQVMASVFLMLSSYHMAALDANMGNVQRSLFFRYGALFFCCLSISGDSAAFYLCLGAWMALSGGSFAAFDMDRPMPLPQPVQLCLGKLNDAGFDAYVVGGCVRDFLLGLTPQDYDLCTNASPRQIQNVFSAYQLVRNGEKHGTIGVVIDHQVYEITTFRAEGEYSDRRHPDWVKFVKDVESDLARRDFTVNAMAYSPVCGFIDPFGGQKDLQEQILRTVGDPTQRFTEDALRILRGVRFATRFRLIPHPETEDAMTRLAATMDSLAQERIFTELSKLLVCATAEDLIRFAPVITQAIPELAPAVGFDQHNPHHCYDIYTHTAHVVENTPRELSLRLAALLHDTGKPETFTMDAQGRGHFYDHAAASARIADAVLQRLRAPTALREQVVFLVEQHMLMTEPDKKLMRRRISKFGAENMRKLLQLQKADFCSKGNQEQSQYFEELETLIGQIEAEDACLIIRDLAVDGNDLMALGLQSGPQLGHALEHLLELVLDEQVANEKDALISVVKEKLL